MSPLLGDSEDASLNRRYLAKGHLGSALKVSWHLSCQPTFRFLVPNSRSGPQQNTDVQSKVNNDLFLVNFKII